MKRAFWVRLRILDENGNNEATFVAASSQKEAEGRTELASINYPGEWATPALGPIAYDPDSETDQSKRVKKEAEKLVDDYMKNHYPK